MKDKAKRPEKKDVQEGLTKFVDKEHMISWHRKKSHNQCHDQFTAFLPKELELWDIFAEVKGCKTYQEDCSFTKCSHWAQCKGLIEALAKLIGTEDKK